MVHRGQHGSHVGVDHLAGPVGVARQRFSGRTVRVSARPGGIDESPGASVKLAIGDASVALRRDKNTWSNASPIELSAGTLYTVRLTVEKVQEVVRVRWQTPGRGWEVLPARYLYSKDLSDNVVRVYTRFAKAAFLASVLELTADEFVYLTAHADYQIDGNGWLNRLPIVGRPGGQTAKALSKALGALLDFSLLKAALSPADERLLAIIEDPDKAAQQDGLLYAVTGWEQTSLAALLTHFGLTPTELANLSTFLRVYRAFQQVRVLGIAAIPLIDATTNEPTSTTVRDLQAALRARHTTDDWLAVIKPINDDLRTIQRDALVCYILHQMRLHKISEHIDTPDKLFEYFLMDVQMQPCMQTSRIRAALSAVQLFVERSLMNLERRVAPSALNVAQWEWMKRYRVWEANRKVFLWPENWLEPELRDDQSPFFREMMSELLQSDITEDRAAAALGNYLVKLNTVAHLEPCAIHYVENEPGTTDDIAYVVARTTGANRSYYWRRREYGYWTPWEAVKLGIEDNPVLPVLWKNRLFLFWLKILTLPNLAPPQPFKDQTSKDLTKVQTGDINNTPAPLTVSAMLCWSEYYNGAWQPVKTSDPERPTGLGSFPAAGFDRSALVMAAVKDGDGIRIVISGQGGSSFLLYNTHSLPVRQEDAPSWSQLPIPWRVLHTGDGKLAVDYVLPLLSIAGLTEIWATVSRSVLENPIGATTVQPRHDLDNTKDAPFFYSDSRHVFYVSTSQRPVTVAEWQQYAPPPPQPPPPDIHIPLILVQQPELRPKPIDPVAIGHNVGISNPAPVEHFLTEDAYISKAIATLGTVAFNGIQIGAAGSLAKRRG